MAAFPGNIPKLNWSLDQNFISMDEAIRAENINAIRKLITQGTDPSVVLNENTGETALHRAVKLGKIDAMKVLLEKGADVNALDNNGQTPLHYACNWVGTNTEEEAKALINLLAQYKANPALKDHVWKTAEYYCKSRSSEIQQAFKEAFSSYFIEISARSLCGL